MPKVVFLPEEKEVTVKVGTTVLQASRKARCMIKSVCGGNASCLTCKVQVGDPSALSPMAKKEQIKVGDGGYRLACQAKIMDHAEIILPEDPLQRAVRKQLQQLKEKKSEG